MFDVNLERRNSARVRWGVGLSWIALAVVGALLWKAVSWSPGRTPLPPIDEPVSEPVSTERYPLPPDLAKALRGAKSLKIYLLGAQEPPGELPASVSQGVQKLPEDVSFLDSYVLGSTRIDSPRAVASIVESLIRGTEHDKYADFGCFFPRHAVRVELADGRRMDLVICFRCQVMRIYSPSGATVEVQMLDDSRKALNEGLQAAGVDLSQPVARYLPEP